MTSDKRIQILLVDDDPSVLFLHELILGECGWAGHLQKFQGAKEALVFLAENAADRTPTIIFLDINMPGMTGWDMLSAMQGEAFGDEVLVVMVTSSINTSDKTKALAFQRVIHFIEKPLTPEGCEEIRNLPRVQPFF